MKIIAAYEICRPDDPSENPKAAVAYACYSEYSVDGRPLRPAAVKSYECPDAPREILVPWLVKKAIDFAASDGPFDSMDVAGINPDGLRSVVLTRKRKQITIISALDEYKLPEGTRYVHAHAKAVARAAAGKEPA